MRPLVICLVLALLGFNGCLLTTGQVLVIYDLPGPADITGPNVLIPINVDLNRVQAYRDHKDSIDELNDFALVGLLTNNSIDEMSDIEVWITPDSTNFGEETQVRANAIPLWGTLHLDRGQATRVDWDASADNLQAAGRDVLLQQARGDGKFTLYYLDASPTYDFTVSEAALVMVVGAGL